MSSSNHSVVSSIKMAIVPKGVRPRRILLGPNRGTKMNLDLAHRTQAILGLYEREISGYLEELTQCSSSAIDVGAADGFYALYFIKQPHLNNVVAVEPSDTERQKLAANMSLNGLANVERLRIIDQRVVDTFEGPDSVTLDEIAHPLPTPIVVKIDVDGGEAKILAGAREILRKQDALWIIETHSLELERTCDDMLQAAGYVTKIVENARYRRVVPEKRVIPHNQWLIAVTRNMTAAVF
jgi:hypothetical protein